MGLDAATNSWLLDLIPYSRLREWMSIKRTIAQFSPTNVMQTLEFAFKKHQRQVERYQREQMEQLDELIGQDETNEVHD